MSIIYVAFNSELISFCHTINKSFRISYLKLNGQSCIKVVAYCRKHCFDFVFKKFFIHIYCFITVLSSVLFQMSTSCACIKVSTHLQKLQLLNNFFIHALFWKPTNTFCNLFNRLAIQTFIYFVTLKLSFFYISFHSEVLHLFT